MKKVLNKYDNKKIAIIGASYLQEPLIKKAKNLGLETHVFAWKCGDPGEETADFFYPVSITKKENILSICKGKKIDGICTIASDLAVITVNYVSQAMDLCGNSVESSIICTDKYEMKNRLNKKNCPCPNYFKIKFKDLLNSNNQLIYLKDKMLKNNLSFPVIVKPTDRSGSRGITKINKLDNKFIDAVKKSCNESFNNEAIVEEYISGKEYSVECISFDGKHSLLAITEKFTTGSPYYIETGHFEPAQISNEKIQAAQKIIFDSLDALMIRNGASHSEIKITKEGSIKIIEIGARMGGDFIGSHLVEMSTGYDFLKAVIDVALGYKPDEKTNNGYFSGVKFVFSQKDVNTYNDIKKQGKADVVCSSFDFDLDKSNTEFSMVTDSSNRHGYFIMRSNNADDILRVFEF